MMMREPGEIFGTVDSPMTVSPYLPRSNDRDILLCFRLTVDQLLLTVRGAAFWI
jgi:hypothetical protein